MGLIESNAWLAGFFAFAAVHYAIQWWLSRSERTLLWFSAYCALTAVFCVPMGSLLEATTVGAAQTALDRVVTFGICVHLVAVHFYASLSARRDRAFLSIVTGVLVLLVVVNQWAPLRGTVLELQPMSLPGGGTGLIAIRTPVGAPLALLYLTVLAIQVYALFLARQRWKHDRWGAALLAAGAVANLLGAATGILVDYAHVSAPFLGAWPHVVFALCMALILAREYSLRGVRVLETERQFETAFEHAPIGKALLTPDGTFLRVNRALTRMLGWTDAELRAKRLTDVTHDVSLVEAPMPAAEQCLVRKDGERVWALLALSAVRDEAGMPAQWIAQVQDVTELRAHRENLEGLVSTRTRELREAKDDADRANRAKSQFLANISHEIRNPLHVILGYVQMLEREPALGEGPRRNVEIVHASARHLSRLLNDVLEMSKIEAGHTELVEEAFDLWHTVEDVEAMFATEAASKGVELTIERAAGLRRSLLGDGGKVMQVLINLVGNAVKFTRKGSIRIRVSSRDHEDGRVRAELVVTDTGAGMPEQDLARMFQPFEQRQDGARAGGTGLGLAISLTHARLMGGDLTAKSAPGEGSAFTFTFVTERGAEEVPEVPLPARLAASDCRVLIVDDEKLNRFLLKELFAQRGFETRMASDGADALSIHGDWDPDLVLVDLRMPGMSGIEAVRRMRDAGSKAAIGALSASALPEDERNALAVGADFFLRKPYDQRELLDRIARALDARAPHTA